MIERKTYIPFGAAHDHSIDYLLGIIKDARTTTLQRIHNISTKELHWQFEEGWNSISALLAHIIACEHVFRIDFIEGRELTKEESDALTPGLEMGKYIPQLITGQDAKEYVHQLEISRFKLIEEINKLSTSDFHKKREGYNPKTGHNLAWTLYHLAEDEVHHRGQISILRKLYRSTQSKENA